ncbi:MAG: hypothetical protein GY832_34110 [Chloroflexi bacterium]|nr:hypothetical protein [Chloroflexota bacterium]
MRQISNFFQATKIRTYPWTILLTAMIVLTVAYLVETLTNHYSTTKATFALEPTFSPPSGYYDRDLQLVITHPNPNSNVIFTVDGSVPTHAIGSTYIRPIRLNVVTPAVTTIRARAILPSGELGPVASASYLVGVPATLPILSLIIDPDDLWDSERGIYVNYGERGIAWERPVDITFMDQDRHSGFHISAGIRVHGGGSRSYEKKSLRLYFRQEYGINRLDYPLFSDSEVQSFKRLILHNGGQDIPIPLRDNWTLMRNQLTSNLALQLDGYAAYTQPVLLFINGESQGVYQIRERIDSHFLDDHYDIESTDFLDSPESDLESIIVGDSEHWDHLLQFVETHDLANPTNYAYVQSQVDIANFIDYNILQIYAVNTNWPYHNVLQFRPRVQGGRWHWIFWDTDHCFGLNPRGHVNSDFIEYVLDYDHPETNGRDVLLLRQLLKNSTFFERFIYRTADLLNTTLASQSVIARIDTLAAELESDIAYETIRWSSSTNWQSNVEELRDFARRRPGFLRQHIVARFNLNDTIQLTFGLPTHGSGTVAVNEFLLHDLPWQGVYFQGTPIQVIAVPTSGYRFAGWNPPYLPQTQALTLTVNFTQTITPRFEPVSGDAPRPNDVVFGTIEKNTLELQVMRPGGVDLRGWRITDNDTKTATDEGSLLFTDSPTLAHIPQNTTILIILESSFAEEIEENSQDDSSIWDRQMTLHIGNGNLDADTDPGFSWGQNDNLVLLAPGPTDTFADDQGIAFASENTAVTPASFGVLVDGVLPTQPN